MFSKYSFLVIFCTLLLFIAACNNTVADNTTVVENSNSIPAPAVLSFNVTNVYPHDTTSYTEGLEWKDGFLYESGGDWGLGKLAKVELKTGKDITRVNYPSKSDFKEGITIFNNKIYQLNYKNQVCHLLDAVSFKELNKFSYDGEGWGMTNDGKKLIMSNGTDKLYFRNPENFQVTNIVSVTDNNGPLAGINELEWVNGFIYANVFMTDKIVKINPETGKVIAEADFAGLLQKYGTQPFSQATESRGPVLNGIAYDAKENRFFITGKLWPKLFEVKFN